MTYRDNDYARNGTVGTDGAPAMRGPGGNRNDFMSSLNDAVRDNPIPAALIGMGALWLFAGGSNMTLFGGRGRTSIMGAAARGAESVAHGASDMAQTAAHSVGRMGSSIASRVSATVGGFAEAASDTAGRVGEYVSDSLHGVDAQASYRNPNFSDHRGGLLRSSVNDVTSSLQDVFERHPVALGVAGLALGVAVAASLPLTSAERETLGKASDAARGKLDEVAAQAKDMASAAVDEIASTTSRRPN